jgi:SagB-type dehydrogenase family enzyme
MDWATQPDPFRRFAGSPVVPLELIPVSGEPRYEPAFSIGRLTPTPLRRASISQLFQDALGLSAWKQAGTARWALRVNPSSGNLHPTEGYLLAGPIPDLYPRPAIYHYGPLAHVLEMRAEISTVLWYEIASQLPDRAVLIGLTSIHWRESWKYGERGFRYCHHDVGHAVASVALAAAGLGWEARLLENIPDEDADALLGVQDQTGVEAEWADCLLAIFPGDPHTDAFPIARQRRVGVPARVRAELRATAWLGTPNQLSRDHHPWPVIDEVAAATRKPAAPPDAFWSTTSLDNPSFQIGDSPLPLRRIIHQRRSAVELDGRTGLTSDAFHQILIKALPGPRQVPFTTLPWQPRLDLLLFVHRVAGLTPGLYALLRSPARRLALASALDQRFTWSRPASCPESLPLFLLEEGDARAHAQHTSCNQAIAADGVCAVAMVADYRAALEDLGPWFYRRLHWEAGAIGQLLYLEAEASGIRATGIGCFFDEVTHRVFGLTGDQFQVLYHFTMGGAVEDDRIQTGPPYPDREVVSGPGVRG